jgi:ribosomal protein S18 acetylase RimI-like enzyme
VEIERLNLPLPEAHRDAVIGGLADLLVDVVAGGASVSFLGDLDRPTAERWWRGTLDEFGPRDRMLIARDGGRIVGTVQVRACWQPNQQFRGEIMKLLVHRQARGRGLASELMRRIEAEAIEVGLTLLVLDTNAGTTADRLYQRLGWTRVGVIPGYCLLHDGTPGDAAFFYRRLGA